jgi:hypothetical protein
VLRIPIAILAVAFFALSATAQNRMGISGGSRFPGSGRGGFRVGERHSTTIFGRGRGRRGFAGEPFFGGYGYYGFPYFDSDYYEPYEPEYPAPMAAAPPTPVPQVSNEPLPDPVLLELRGNQWVRVANFGEASQHAVTGETSAEQQASAKAPPAPPAILVYRDGHSEEVSSYSIIGETIYTKADYWTEGAWTRSIPIAELDIPATLRENQQRGTKFELPSGPDEVMIRP